MVGLVKKCLKNIVLGVKIVFEEIETVLCEIELTLNNQPLTFTYKIGDEVYQLTRAKKIIHTFRVDLFI